MRKNWTETTLGDAVTVQKGKKPPALVASGESSHPYLTADVLRGATCEQFVPDELLGPCIQLNGRETVLLWDGAGAGDVFRSQLGVLASTMAKLVARDSHLIDDGYLFLFLNSKQITIKSSCRGTTVPHVSPEALVSLKLSLPPLIEQERIVDLVSSVDSYIFALQQQADAARAARSAVLNELLSADGNDWRQVAIHDAVELGRERLDPRSIDASTMLHHWSIPALDEVGGPIYEPAGAIKSHKFRVRRNAVVFSLLNPRIPRYALIEGGEDVVCSTEFAVMYPKSNVLNEFLLVLVSSALFQEKVTSSADGTTKSRERTRPSDFDRISIVLPSLDEQSRIATLVTSIDVLIQTNKRALSEARSLRSALLSDLLSGDHEIRESYDRLLGAA